MPPQIQKAPRFLLTEDLCVMFTLEVSPSKCQNSTFLITISDEGCVEIMPTPEFLSRDEDKGSYIIPWIHMHEGTAIIHSMVLA